jgi:hypothetical protein
MKRGINVEKMEKEKQLRIIDYTDFYVINEKYDKATTNSLLEKFCTNSKRNGFNCLRVFGEMDCFFNNNLIEELIERENVGRILNDSIIGLCAYNITLFDKIRNKKLALFNKLQQAHGISIFSEMDEKIGKMEILEAARI